MMLNIGLTLSYRHTLVQWFYYVRNLNDLGFCSPCATKSLFLFATMGCIFVTLTNEEHMLWCLAEIILLDSLDHQKSHMYLIPCCQFLANSYFIFQIYHAKSFKMMQVTSLYFNFSVWYVFMKCLKNSILLSGSNRTSERLSYLFSLLLKYWA